MSAANRVRKSLAALVGVLLTAGVLVVVTPGVASAHQICLQQKNFNPGTYLNMSCKSDSEWIAVWYRPNVECHDGTNYVTRVGTWQVGYRGQYGPWTMATCPSGFWRTYSWADYQFEEL